MNGLLSIDIDLFRQINSGWIHPAADWFFYIVGDWGDWKIPLAFLGTCLLVFGSFRIRLCLLLLLLSVLIGACGVNLAIKTLSNRPRPYQALEEVRHFSRKSFGTFEIKMVSKEPWHNGHSMPSGHVANNFALGLIVTLVFGARGLWIWIWVLAMAWSRIYTGDHYPSDVAVSMFVSLLYTTGICCATGKLWQKWGGRLAPNLYARYPRLFDFPRPE